MKASRFCRVVVGFMGAVVMPVSAQTVWNDSLQNGSWSSSGNWTPATVPGVGGATGADVQIGTMLGGDTSITLDTEAILGDATASLNSLTFNSGLVAIDIGSDGNTTLQVASGITNNSSNLQTISAPVMASGNMTIAGGNGILFDNSLNVGTFNVATTGNVSASGSLVFVINSTAPGMANTTFGTIGTVNASNATITISAASTYITNATLAADAGDFFQFTTGGFNGASGISTPAFTDPGLIWITSLSTEGIFFVQPSAGGNFINAGVTLPIDTDSELNSGSITFRGGELINDGPSFNTSRLISVNTTGGTIAVIPGDTGTYTGVISDGDGPGALMIGDGVDTGTVLVTAANTYTGGTTINNATLQLSGAGNIGASTGALTIESGGVLDLGGLNRNVGALVLGSGGSTITTTTGTGSLTTTGVTVNDVGNLIDTSVTVTGATSITTGADLTVKGSVVGTTALASSASLDGTGNVAAVTLAGSDTLDSTSTLTTTGITVGGSGNTVSTGTVTGNVTINNLGALLVASGAKASGTISVLNGGTLSGRGATGAVTVSGGGNVNLVDNAIGVLTVGGFTSGGGTASALTFEIGTTVGSVDNISTGALTLNTANGTKITIANLNNTGSQTLQNGTYDLITYSGSLTGSLANLSLQTTSLDGHTLLLSSLSGGELVLTVSGASVATNGQYTLASTVATSTIVHANGGTTTLHTTITNSGSGTQDTLNYSALTATATAGTVGAGTNTSGTALAQGATGATDVQTYTAGATLGAITITPTATVTNTTASGTPVLTTSGTTVNVYSGLSTWAGNGTAAASWGTLAGTGVNTFGGNWGANQGSPGLDAAFTSSDTATFGNVSAQATQTVDLNGASPSLNSITFNGTTTSYTIAQGSGGTLTLNGGVGSATIADSATSGSQTISAPVVLATNVNANVSGGDQLILSGVVSGTGSLTMTGTGTVTLSNTDSYTGTTNVNAGILNVTGSTAAGSTVNVGTNGTLTGNGTIHGNATLTGTGTIALTSPGTISGTLGVTGGDWNGAGTVTGLVMSSSGVFTIGASSNLTANGGVNVTGGSIAAAASTGTITGNVNYTSTTNSTFSGVVAGSGKTLTLNSSGTTLILSGANAYTGATTVTAGTLEVDGSTVSGSAVNIATTGTLTGAGTIGGNTTLTGNGIINLTSPGTIAGTLGVTGGNWSGTGTVTGLVTSSSGTFTINNGDTLTASNGVSITGGKTVATGNISGTVTVSGTGTLAGTGTIGNLAVNTGGAVNLTDGAIGTLTVGAYSANAGALTFEIGGVTTATDAIDSGALTIGAGTTTITIGNLGGTSQTLTDGSYTLIQASGISGTFSHLHLNTGALDGKTFTLSQVGNTVDLVVADAAAGATNGQYTLASAATGSTLVHINGTTTLNTTLTNTGSGTQDTLDYTGLGAQASSGAITGATASGTGLAQSSTAQNAQTFTAGSTGGSVTITSSATVTNTTASGTPTLVTSTGTTLTVYTGQGVWAGNGTSTGSWGTLLSGFGTNWGATQGSPGLDSNFTTTDTATFGNVAGQATQTVNLAGASPSLKSLTFSGTTTTYTLAQGSGGTLKLNGGASAATLTNSSGNNTISAPVEFDSNVAASVAGTNTLTISGVISEAAGVHGLTKSGTGTLLLDGANSYSGGNTVTAGTLAVGTNGTLGATTGALNVGAATLDLGGTSQVVGAVALTGAGTIQNGTLTGTSYAASSASGMTTLNAILAGAAVLTKTGGGTLALNGANTFSGGTSISAGTVMVGNASALGTNNVTMSGGTLEAGNGVHQINVAGNYTQTGGTLVLNLTGTSAGANPGYDFLHVTGTAALGGSLNVIVGSPYVATAGDAFTFVQAGTITGGFTHLSTNLGSLSITQQGAGIIVSQLPFATLAGVTYTPNEKTTARYIDKSFADGANSVPFQKLMGALNVSTAVGASPTALPDAFNQLSPEKFADFTRSTIFNNVSFSSQFWDSYMEGQRTVDGEFVGGNGEIDSSGLTVVDPSMDPALAQVGSHLLAWSPAPLSHGMLSDTPDPVLGGIDMKQANMASATPPEGRNFDAFVLGNVVLAQNFSQDDVPHSDTTTGAVQVGGSYRITPHLRAGATFAYGHTDASLDNIGSKATVDSYAPGAFVAYVNNGWYFNALGSYGFDNFTQDRMVSFGGLTGDAHSAPSGDQIVGNLDGGYDFHQNRWTFGPTAGVQYTHLDVNGYKEDGVDPVDLSVNKNETDSLRSRLGGHVSYFLNTGKFVLSPHLDVSWQHEFMDQSRGINSQFLSVGTGSFNVNTPSPSRDSALIDTGLSADMNGQFTLYLDYIVQAGQDNYFGQAVQAGAKIGF